MNEVLLWPYGPSDCRFTPKSNRAFADPLENSEFNSGGKSDILSRPHTDDKPLLAGLDLISQLAADCLSQSVKSVP